MVVVVVGGGGHLEMSHSSGTGQTVTVIGQMSQTHKGCTISAWILMCRRVGGRGQLKSKNGVIWG